MTLPFFPRGRRAKRDAAKREKTRPRFSSLSPLSRRRVLSSPLPFKVKTFENAVECVLDTSPSCPFPASRCDSQLRNAPLTCPCPLPAGQWDSPLRLRPNPGTKILRVRRGSTPVEGCYCSLMVNTGRESKGENFLVDFCTGLFRGTLLLRVRVGAPLGYFAKRNRQYQAVVRGKFLEEVKISECVTGHVFHEAMGNLPPRWVRRGAMGFLGVIAPQLEADFERGVFLTPLASTPQVLSRGDTGNIEDPMEEPVEGSILPLLGEMPNPGTSMQRTRRRKTLADRHFAQKGQGVFGTEEEYTFEFLQHLMDFESMSLNLGFMGSIGLEESLDGRPMNVMAARKGEKGLEYLWGFELWHERLYERARQNGRLEEPPT